VIADSISWLILSAAALKASGDKSVSEAVEGAPVPPLAIELVEGGFCTDARVDSEAPCGSAIRRDIDCFISIPTLFFREGESKELLDW